MSQRLDAIQALIIDMDGVLWRGTETLPGVADFFAFLDEHRIAYLLATNNATRSAEHYVERMAALGIAVPVARVLTSATATARQLQHALPAGASVLVVGEEGLIEAITRANFKVIDPADAGEADRHPDAVVVGLDRHLTYEKLRRASFEIRNGSLFVATNGDATFPSEKGLVPGAGTVVAAVETASGRVPTIIGKPHRPMFDTALDELQTPRASTAMLGDRLDTDIEGGHAVGLTTILVLTGVSTLAEVDVSAVKPDFTFPDLVALRQAWAEAIARR